MEQGRAQAHGESSVPQEDGVKQLSLWRLFSCVPLQRDDGPCDLTHVLGGEFHQGISKRQAFHFVLNDASVFPSDH